MQRSSVEFAGQFVSLSYPPELGETIEFLFGEQIVNDAPSDRVLKLTQKNGDQFRLEPWTGDSPIILQRADLPEFLMDGVVRGLVTDQSQGVALHAAALMRGGKTILVSGISGSGKSSLTGWMSHNGFGYLTDELVLVPATNPRSIIPFHRPLTMRLDSFSALMEHGTANDAHRQMACGDKVLISLPSDDKTAPNTVSAIIFPTFRRGSELQITSISAGQCALRLLENNLNGENLADGGLTTVAEFAQSVPALELSYGDYADLDGTLDHVVDGVLSTNLDVKTWHRVFSAFGKDTRSRRSSQELAQSDQVQQPPPKKINEATPPRGKFKLTVGMATYDDFDGVYFSIQAMRLNNPELLADIEFLVIDNNPEGPCGDALKELEGKCPSYRYIPFAGQSGTATRDIVFNEASGEFVLCIDCHVLLGPGVLKRLLDYIDENPDTADLLQGPLIYDGLDSYSTHFDPVWKDGMYGVWAMDDRANDIDGEPFDIPMQGLGLFACRRDAWPGFNLKFRGFGGEEGYLHEKFRQRGGRALCLPFLRWLHRFPRPMGVPYKVKWEDRIRNYTIGFRELGLDEVPIDEHFRKLLGKGPMARIKSGIDSELGNPFNWFDAIRCINLDNKTNRRRAMEKRFTKLGINQLVNRFPAIETPDNHHIGCALSHRAIVADAKRRGLRNVLVFEDDTIFDRDIIPEMIKVVAELKSAEWDMLFLGGVLRHDDPKMLPGSDVLASIHYITCCHAIAYNHNYFDVVLQEMPADQESMTDWIEANWACDQYFASSPARKLLTQPMLAMQPGLFDQRGKVDRTRFAI